MCLTVTDLGKDVFGLDVSGETLSRSTLKSLKPGDEVNLERALRLSDRLGGHIVSGHVDGVGKIVRIEQREVFRQHQSFVGHQTAGKGGDEEGRNRPSFDSCL